MISKTLYWLISAYQEHWLKSYQSSSLYLFYFDKFKRSNKFFQLQKTNQYCVSEISAVAKVKDSYLCGWSLIPGKICSFLKSFLNGSLPLYFVCSD